MKHTSDPTRLHQAAAFAGVQMAEGAATWNETAALCRQLAKETTVRDVAIRLCWTAMAAADDHAKAVWQAEDAVREAVRPLMARNASKAQIEEAAGTAAGATLGWPRIYAILREEVARHKHVTRWRR